MRKRQSFLHGAAILAGTVAVVKVMGALYKIPLGRIMGDEGFAHFNVAYNIYAILLTVSVAGLPTAMSRLVANADALGNQAKVRKIFTSALWAFMFLGGISTLVMFTFAGKFAQFMGDTDAAASIAALSPAVLFVCFMGAFRGYSQGLSDMVPTSVTQVVETAAKLIVGLVLAQYLLSRGYGLETVSAGAISGVTVGAGLALLYMVLRVRVPKRSVTLPAVQKDENVVWQLFKIGVPMALGSSVLNIIMLIDSKFILERLQLYSPGSETIMYGAYAKAQTLSNIPSSFVVPLTLSIIPAIAARLAQGNRKGASAVTDTALKITFLLALPCAVGLCVLAEPVSRMVYPDSHPDGSIALMLLAAASFFVCLTLVTNAILQANGHERIPVYVMAAGATAKIACTYVLTPFVGIRGAAVGTIICFGLISIINIIILRAKTGKGLPGKTLRLILANAVMGASALFAYFALERLFSGRDGTIFKLAELGGAIAAAVLVYLVLTVSLKIITREDLAFMPKGDKIARLLRVR